MSSVSLNTRLSDITLGELLEVLNAKTPRYVHSFKELSKELGISPTTLWRMKKDGLLDGAYIQYGRCCRIDVDKVYTILSTKR